MAAKSPFPPRSLFANQILTPKLRPPPPTPKDASQDSIEQQADKPLKANKAGIHACTAKIVECQPGCESDQEMDYTITEFDGNRLRGNGGIVRRPPPPPRSHFGNQSSAQQFQQATSLAMDDCKHCIRQTMENTTMENTTSQQRYSPVTGYMPHPPGCRCKFCDNYS